jgi:phospholipid transport system substrate-binding protein
MLRVNPSLPKTIAVFALVIATLSFIASRAHSSDSPSAFIQRLIDNTQTVLADQTIDQGQRHQAFAMLLERDFALDRIGRLALGRHHRAADAAERQNYRKLFAPYLVATYANRLDNAFKAVGGTAIEIRFGEPRLVKKDQVMPSTLEAGSKRLAIDWRVREIDGTWRVIDITVEGVSMVITQRNEFGSIINAGDGLRSLNDHLRARISSSPSMVLASQ